MLFILIGLIAFGCLTLLVFLFSINYWLGFTGLFLIILVLFLMGRKVFGVQNKIELKEIEDFKKSLEDIYGIEVALEIETILFKTNPISKAHTMHLVLKVNEQFKLKKPNPHEGLSAIITSVESSYGKEHSSLYKLKSLQTNLP
jgi:hypothetical protein